jgi:hypothetical protein
VDLQALLVALIVPACALYAAWRLAPAGLKQRVARRMLGKPMPRPVAAALQRAAGGASTCGCDGCDRVGSKPAAPAADAPITLHRRRT